jgi:hypothetical protein
MRRAAGLRDQKGDGDLLFPASIRRWMDNWLSRSLKHGRRVMSLRPYPQMPRGVAEARWALTFAGLNQTAAERPVAAGSKSDK